MSQIYFILLESSYFSYLEAHAKIWNPTTTPYVVLNSGGKNNKRKKIPKIVATFVYASSQGQRTHSARTNYPIFTEALVVVKLLEEAIPVQQLFIYFIIS